jgi:hypothetical protein
MKMLHSLETVPLVTAGDSDVEYIRYGRTTHRKGLPGLTLCGLSDSEYAGAMPSTADKYNCKECKRAKC